MSIEKTDRNTQIYKEKVDQDITYRELSLKYNLAIQTIQTIVKREKIKRLMKKHSLELR